MSDPPSPPYPSIPYGWAFFRGIREEGCLYVDKTRFLHALERERYVFFLRPRRFGKTCWLSLLECYYDRKQSGDFEAIFGGTDVGRRPTANRSRYVILRFNFSAFGDALPTLEERFEEYCRMVLRSSLERNEDLFPEPAQRRILAPPAIKGGLNELFRYAGERGIPLYVLIDEYDNFANTILAHEGAEAYHSFTHGGGFFRSFFATLKAGTETGALGRLFITGVSPVTMDDVTSGFNIGRNLSLRPEFNELLGFTEAEVRGVLETYRDLGVFDQDVDAVLALMREWYDGYRFAKDAVSHVYNTDMVLHYLMDSVPNRSGPNDLIDVNVRIDYGKLRHLLLVNREMTAASSGGARSVSNRAELAAAKDVALNGNFDLLRHVIAEGRVDSEIVASFPLGQLGRREHFLSLMHCFGLLGIRGMEGGTPRLGIPNQTVRVLMYGYLRDAYDDVGAFSVDLFTFARLTREMARDGAWRPAVEFLADAIARQTGVRDYIQGEKLLQGFLAAYLGASGHFVFHTERELNFGYADMVLEPLTARYPVMRHGYAIELKYLKREEGGEAEAEAAAREAADQLRRYLADERLARQYPSVRFTGLALVFRGWELVRCEEVSGGGARPPPQDPPVT